MISTTSHTAQPDRPERSRNAKAQARHRAKRKAYIEQLEQTVTKLQTALDFSPEEVAALPPPLLRIRELEQENARLEKENDDLRRMLSDFGGRGVPMEMSRRSSPSMFSEARLCDRDFKRRKMGGSVEGLYMNNHDAPQNGDSNSRPPPLMIPQSVPHHYSQISSSASHNSVNGSSMYSLHGPTFQMPDTPSGSSATSSPPFSPAQMQEPLHSPVNHRAPVSQNPVMSNYTQRTHPYAGVKVEEDNYVALRHQQPHGDGHYPLHASYNNNAPTNGMDWHAYSAERAHIHR